VIIKEVQNGNLEFMKKKKKKKWKNSNLKNQFLRNFQFN